MPEDEEFTIEPGDGNNVFFVDHVRFGTAEVLTMNVVYALYDNDGELQDGRNVVTLVFNEHAEADLKMGMARQAMQSLAGEAEMRRRIAESN